MVSDCWGLLHGHSRIRSWLMVLKHGLMLTSGVIWRSTRTLGMRSGELLALLRDDTGTKWSPTSETCWLSTMRDNKRKTNNAEIMHLPPMNWTHISAHLCQQITKTKNVNKTKRSWLCSTGSDMGEGHTPNPTNWTWRLSPVWSPTTMRQPIERRPEPWHLDARTTTSIATSENKGADCGLQEATRRKTCPNHHQQLREWASSGFSGFAAARTWPGLTTQTPSKSQWDNGSSPSTG